MSPERYDLFLRLVSTLITKQDTNLREAIPAGLVLLAICGARYCLTLF